MNLRYTPSARATRSPAGDLTFERSEDPIIQARNNLEYWVDRYPAGSPEGMTAAKFMLAAIDQHYTEGA